MQGYHAAERKPTVGEVRTVLGIDEAGRGCVIGPMVLCGVLIDERMIPALVAEGVTDSKALTPARRVELSEKIMQMAEAFFIEEITPSEIENRSLNLLEIWRAARIISAAKPDRVYIDAPVAEGKGVQGFCEHLRRCLRGECPEIIAENRADSTYTVVGAGSILAKVRRDQRIEELQKEHGDFGSGYPSDERTQRFLEKCYRETGGFPDCVRLRWETVRRIAGPVQGTFPFAMEEG
jgi:ribonuclease HII